MSDYQRGFSDERSRHQTWRALNITPTFTLFHLNGHKAGNWRLFKYRSSKWNIGNGSIDIFWSIGPVLLYVRVQNIIHVPLFNLRVMEKIAVTAYFQCPICANAETFGRMWAHSSLATVHWQMNRIIVVLTQTLYNPFCHCFLQSKFTWHTSSKILLYFWKFVKKIQ